MNHGGIDYSYTSKHEDMAQAFQAAQVITQSEPRTWLIMVQTGSTPEGKPLATEHVITARSLSEREVKMDDLGIDRELHRWAAGHLDDRGRPVDVGNDPVLRARLRLELPVAFRR